MTARDLSCNDIDGFLKEHAQRADEARFAQQENEWTPATPLEDVAILLWVFCICLVFLGAPLGYFVYKAFP